jgi:cytochrome c oxidase cbb3-type subunit 3
MMRFKYCCLMIATLLGSAIFAQERAPDNRWWAWPMTPDAQSVQRGKALYVASCGSCHAANATGTAKGSNLVQSALVRHDKDGSAIAAVIRSGVAGKGMPPIELSDAQIADVVSYIRQAIQTYDNPSAGPLPANYPAEDLLTGNAQAGKVFFEGAGGCAGCHSPTGDLAGIASKYTAAQLEARFMMPRSSKPRTATVTTSSGEKITGMLLVINNYDVSVRLPDGTAQSWPADGVKVEIKDPLEAHRQLLDKYTDADMHNMLAYLWTLK